MILTSHHIFKWLFHHKHTKKKHQRESNAAYDDVMKRVAMLSVLSSCIISLHA
jgi:hypothetical protein